MKPIVRVPIWKVLVGLGVFTLLTGGLLSWFASTHPDGLEWSIEKITGKAEISGPVDGGLPLLGVIQEKTAIFPDYEFKDSDAANDDDKQIEQTANDQSASTASPGTTVAGIVGSLMTLVLACFIGFVMKRRNRQGR